MGGRGSGVKKPEAEVTHHTVTAKLSKVKYRRLRQVADRQNTSMSALVRRWVDEGIKRELLPDEAVMDAIVIIEAGGTAEDAFDVIHKVLENGEVTSE